MHKRIQFWDVFKKESVSESFSMDICLFGRSLCISIVT